MTRTFRTSSELRTPLKDRVTARVPMERALWRRLADEAHERETSVAEILRVLAARWIDRLDAATPRQTGFKA